jgi:hypothetical protein
MRGWLLDVNTLLGCGWKSHANCRGLTRLAVAVERLGYLPIVESGFVRITMTKAYEASFDDVEF